VRKGRASDAKGLSEIFRLSWQQAYCGIIPHAYLENLIRRRGPDWWKSALRSSEDLFVLEADGKLAGYATMGASRTQTGRQGEIYEIYLAPVYQGLGMGEHLFEACRHRLDQRMLKGLIVWALTDNEGAQNFYWGRGGRPVARAFDRMGKTRLEKIAFAWD
jgi:ribosomal protein S18 acetylase RimI-like enzyme